ncbi:MAG: zinc-dependent peptidase [Synoicihabitans sp.]
MSFWAKLAAWLNPPDPEPITFKPEWIDVLSANIPLYQKLPDGLKTRLHDRLTLFVAQKNFEACGGLELTDEMVLTIAGQACLLSLNHDGPPLPLLRTILIYPTAYRAIQTSVNAAGVVMQRETVRLGESTSSGTVVLAWDAVLQGAKNCFDGHNVSIHEFAHQLDQARGPADGIPFLKNPNRYARWTQMIETGHARLERMSEKGRRTVLDKYGATNTAEFFAVATEAFFEKPRQLARKQPELYEELKRFYEVDPAPWFDQG